LSLFLGKEVLIETLELEHPARAHADAVFDHKFGQALAVDEDHPLWDLGREFDSMRREGRRRYKYALRCAEADEAACERLYFRAAD
jgi:hypothetical protein